MDDDDWNDLTADQKLDWLRSEFHRLVEHINAAGERNASLLDRVKKLESESAQKARKKS